MYMSIDDIRREIKAGKLKIEPFDEKSLTPNGYDLRLNEINDIPVSGMETIHKGESIVVKTKETITLPNNIIGFMFLRSRYTRIGIIGGFAVIDAGFSGKIIASMINLSNKDYYELNTDDGVIHIVFAYLKTPSSEPYGSTSKSHFQNQK